MQRGGIKKENHSCLELPSIVLGAEPNTRFLTSHSASFHALQALERLDRALEPNVVFAGDMNLIDGIVPLRAKW